MIKATADAHPAGLKLELQTFFGEAGAHLAAEDLSYAAELAMKIPDPILGIEAYRMATFCLGRMKREKGQANNTQWNSKANM